MSRQNACTPASFRFGDKKTFDGIYFSEQLEQKNFLSEESKFLSEEFEFLSEEFEFLSEELEFLSEENRRNEIP
jgi:hypothetical protein